MKFTQINITYHKHMNRKYFSKVLAVVVVTILLFALTGCDWISPNKTTVTLSDSAISIGVGDNFTLTATASDDSKVTWQSMDEEIATVSNGVVTGISAGQTEIVAMAGKSYAVCEVSVVAEMIEGELFMPLKSARLQIGDSITLDTITARDADIAWTTSNASVATVDDGVVSGVSTGIARITASVNGFIQECEITVSDQKTVTITLSKGTVYVKEGESVALVATTSDSSVTWLSDNNAVATVDKGIVSGISTGTVLINAWSTHASAACYVTVSDPSDTYKPGYNLVWHDEFSGSALDLTKWGYMTGVQDVYGNSHGPMYWGNNELQYYTEDAATVRDGSLIITATRQDTPDDRTSYTSARLHTRDKGHWTYGYFEARMQTPAIVGMWPAFWMLPQPASPSGTGNKYGGWPANGEIDIMEARGSSKNWVVTTLHFANSSGQHDSQGVSSKISGTTEDWHIYALEWTEDHMSWYIDGIEVLRVESSRWNSLFASASSAAPYDVDFYILLNLAVGGNFDGGRAPDDSFVSAEMRVDYVRVYQAL